MVVDGPALAVRTVKLDEIIIGMVTNEDVRTKDGLLLLAKGQEITSSALADLRSFNKTVGLVGAVAGIGARRLGSCFIADTAACCTLKAPPDGVICSETADS